ncbi:MAG: hypothetical protein IIW31_01545 [Clostridia bacterium]|nr:hypothetical protein [Clostridia bacterium]
MKQKKSSFLIENGQARVLHKSSAVSLFRETYSLRYGKGGLSAGDRLNVIYVPAPLYQSLRFEKLCLINTANGASCNVSLQPSSVSEGTFCASPYLQGLLSLSEGDQALLCRYEDRTFSKTKPQKVDHIREGDLMISPADANGLFCDFEGSPFRLFEVYNTYSHDSIVVRRSHIYVDPSLDEGTVRLSRKQRICLGLEVPQYLTDCQWDLLEKTLDPESDAYRVIHALYGSNDHVLDKSASYNDKMAAKRIVAKECPSDIKIVPVPESTRLSSGGILRRVCDFYVGKSTISLVCRRPYDIDEGLDIVRMTRSNMNLLGIDEMDKVILQYKGNRVSCRVLELSDGEAFLETNLPISPDLVVGIPAHIRRRLGIMDLSSSLKIDRDTSFIFIKSINEQIVPILLTLFSTNLFTDSSVIVSALLSLVAVPVVLYFNLSSKRNMRA